MSPRLRLLVVGLFVMVGALVAHAPDAAAQKAHKTATTNPNKIFAGQVKMSDKRFPSSAKSAAAYTAAIKKQAKTAFYENKADGTWKIYFVAFLRAPLDDLEYAVKLYEIGN